MFDARSNRGDVRVLERHFEGVEDGPVRSITDGVDALDARRAAPESALVRVNVLWGMYNLPPVLQVLGYHFIQGIRFDSHETSIGGIIRVWRVKLGETVGHGNRRTGVRETYRRSSRPQRACGKTVSVPPTRSVLFSFSLTIHDELGTPKGEPIASGSEGLLGGVAPVRGLVVKVFHAINT